MMLWGAGLLLVWPQITGVETPVREGYARTYYTRDGALTYIATTRPGISISDLNDKAKWAAYLKANPPLAKPFYIRVYRDRIDATNMRTHDTDHVPIRDLVKIDWMPKS